MSRSIVVVMCLAIGLSVAHAAEQPATVDELAWLAGEWRGEGIGGHSMVETWSRPVAGRMVGHFVQTGTAGVSFLELISIEQQGGELVYRVKHFTAALHGWEKPDEVVSFPLQRRIENRWEFEGLTLVREDEDRMTAILIIQSQQGGERKQELKYRRLR